MIFLHAYINSLKLPQKKALFQLNRLGMDVVVVYIFILLFFASFPSLINQIIYPNDFTKDMNTLFFIIYFFIFHYLPINLIVFAFFSLVSFIGTWIAKLLGRRLKFSILWKMYAFSTTLPFTIYIIISFVYKVNQIYLWVAIIYTLFLFIRMILIYPKRKTH